MNSKYLYSVLAFTVAMVLIAFFMTLTVLLPQLWQTGTYGNLRNHPSMMNVTYDANAPKVGSTLKAPTLLTLETEPTGISPQVEQSLEPEN